MLALPFGDYRDTEQLCCDVISGGLNGGALTKIVTGALILNIFLSLVDLAESIGLIITSMAGLIATAPLGTMIIAAALVVVGIACSVFAVIEIGKSLWLYYRYINGDKDAGLDLIENTAYNLLFTLLFVVGSSAAKHFLKNSVKKALYSIMGSDFVENMLKEFDDIFTLKKCVKQLQDMGFSVGVIIELSDVFGKKGLDWLLSKKGLGLTDDLVRKIIKAGNLDWFTDDVMRAIINSNGYADDIIDLIKKYGKDAADAIGKYGDDAVEVFKKYGDDAVDGFKNGKTPDEIKADMDNVDSGGGSSGGGDTDTGVGTTGGDNGGAGSGTGVYTDTIKWGIHEIKVRPEGNGYWGERIVQSEPRVDAYEIKINPSNESYYLPHPDGGYVQFENMLNGIVQDGKLVMQQKSFYHVYDMPDFARTKVLQEAQRQIEAANVANYKIEWLVSEEKAVEQLTKFFEEQNINITVKYYPE